MGLRLVELNGRRLYTGLRLHYILRLWAVQGSYICNASRAISAAAELLVSILVAVVSVSCFGLRRFVMTMTILEQTVYFS